MQSSAVKLSGPSSLNLFQMAKWLWVDIQLQLVWNLSCYEETANACFELESFCRLNRLTIVLETNFWKTERRRLSCCVVPQTERWNSTHEIWKGANPKLYHSFARILLGLVSHKLKTLFFLLFDFSVVKTEARNPGFSRASTSFAWFCPHGKGPIARVVHGILRKAKGKRYLFPFVLFEEKKQNRPSRSWMLVKCTNSYLNIGWEDPMKIKLDCRKSKRHVDILRCIVKGPVSPQRTKPFDGCFERK